jgi:hypothetical protein
MGSRNSTRRNLMFAGICTTSGGVATLSATTILGNTAGQLDQWSLPNYWIRVIEARLGGMSASDGTVNQASLRLRYVYADNQDPVDDSQSGDIIQAWAPTTNGNDVTVADMRHLIPGLPGAGVFPMIKTSERGLSLQLRVVREVGDGYVGYAGQLVYDIWRA